MEIMELASEVLRAVAPEQEPPESVRRGELPPQAVRTTEAELPESLAHIVKTELAEIGEGRVAVLTPDARHSEISSLVTGSAAGAVIAPALDSPVAVLTVAQCKGLEFDAVVVVAPDEILAQSPMGGHDLYVAITRATRRLTVVYERSLPQVLASLDPHDRGPSAP
jgi:DNA helicase IV